MAQVVVNIAGRTYRMACEDGEEPHLTELARIVEEKILALRQGFGEIGEQRIVVMAAITIADEIAAGRRKIAALEAELAAVQAEADASRRRSEAREAQIAASLDGASERLERLAATLARSDAGAEALD